MTKRAAKGGQVGANGEWYEGGKFINTIPENRKREGSTARQPRKVQVEPYVWVVSDRKPIFSLVGGVACYIDRYQPAKGIMPFAPALAHYGDTWGGKTVQEWCDLYNAGERWMN